jgi:hypothetical protein
VIIANGDLRSVPLVPGQDFFENLVEAIRFYRALLTGAEADVPHRIGGQLKTH